jgi:hypothetical protein
MEHFVAHPVDDGKSDFGAVLGRINVHAERPPPECQLPNRTSAVKLNSLHEWIVFSDDGDAVDSNRSKPFILILL